MSGSLTIRQASLVLPDRCVTGDLLIEDGVIAQIGPSVDRVAGPVIDGTGLTVLPGVIDGHVHFREPGKNKSEDIGSGSRAAAAGGVTAFLDMPNNTPPTTTVGRLHHKLQLAAEKSVVHYGFFIGATGDNLDELLAAERTCGIKVFLGSSTGTLLVSDPEVLETLFRHANKPIGVHAEDEARLRERMRLYADSENPADHAKIRDEKTAYNATRLALELAARHGARLHVLHLTSAEEVHMLRKRALPNVTAEVCPHHLLLHADEAYERLGTRAQCNPPVRTPRHAQALWHGLMDGTIQCIASDHAPHPLAEKQKGYPRSPSGMPNVEWSLPLLLDRVNAGKVGLTQVARWMCEAPAACYGIPRKGRLEVGFDGDIVVVDMQARRLVEDGRVHTGCGWSPWVGREIQGWPVLTAVLGQPVFRDGEIIEGVRGRELTFRASA